MIMKMRIHYGIVESRVRGHVVENEGFRWNLGGSKAAWDGKGRK